MEAERSACIYRHDHEGSPYRAETVWLTIRYALAWHDFPEGGQWVDFYEPMNRSDQPMPKVELKLKGEEK